ncbi:hypothetical protein FACS1894109_05420 [Spirochaetia bacterium]|nr:hypothetical protein FACS1894109_05420 [Spirochaetia bacterium]
MNICQKRFLLFLLLSVALSALPLWGMNYDDGRMRLILNDDTGRFSLYYMTDVANSRYEALFADQDPRTSLLAVNQNDKTFRLGETNTFNVRIGGGPTNPALIFESSTLVITEEFSFIKTANAPAANGVKITLKVENKGARTDVGLRLLLDTSLGEGGVEAPFMTNLNPVVTESIFDSSSGAQWWLSRNDHLSLMGSISSGDGTKQDLVHIANWKRLNDAPWTIEYVQGRNFNNLPQSIGDSAVAYYFDPRRMEKGAVLSFSLFLAADNGSSNSLAQGFTGYTDSSHNAPAVPRSSTASVGAAQDPAAMQKDLDGLRDMIIRIDAYINSGLPISDQELLALEREIAQLRARYNSIRSLGGR